MKPTFGHRLVNIAQSALLIGAMALILWFSVSVVIGGSGLWLAMAAILLGLVALPSLPKGMILSAYRARRLGPEEFPAGVAVVAELARRAELPKPPELYWIPSSMPNAFAIGSPSDSVICVTDALLRIMDDREFTGILAHEISHIAHRDLWIMGLADVMARVVSTVSYIGQLMLFINLPLLLGGAAVIPWQLPLVLIFAPTVMALTQLALSRNREFDADLGAARLTGDPEGLARALEKLERRMGRFWEEIFLPGRRIPEPSLLRTHPPTEQRVARLRSLIVPKRPSLPPAHTLSARTFPAVRRPGFHGPWGLFY